MKTLAKALARAIATVLVMPALLSFRLRAVVLGPDRALEGSTQAFALLPGLAGRYLRCAFLRRVLAECHPSAAVEFGTTFSDTGTRIEENVYIGPRCHIGLAHIERDVLIGAAVHVPSGGHLHGMEETDRPIREQARVKKLVRIGSGCWIGSGAIVMAAVGQRTVVGAGTVVTKPLPDFVVAAGVPARVMKTRTASGE